MERQWNEVLVLFVCSNLLYFGTPYGTWRDVSGFRSNTVTSSPRAQRSRICVYCSEKLVRDNKNTPSSSGVWSLFVSVSQMRLLKVGGLTLKLRNWNLWMCWKWMLNKDSNTIQKVYCNTCTSLWQPWLTYILARVRRSRRCLFTAVVPQLQLWHIHWLVSCGAWATCFHQHRSVTLPVDGDAATGVKHIVWTTTARIT